MAGLALSVPAQGTLDGPVSGQAPRQSPSGFPVQLSVGVLTHGWAPFDGLKNGQLSGMSVDYLHALVGPGVTLVPRIYPDMTRMLAAACAGEVDLVMSVARTPEREHCLSFTAPYFRASTSVVVDGSRRNAMPSHAQLDGASFAIERGFALERFLRERFPRAKIEIFADTDAALNAVVEGKVDAYLGFTPSARYYLADRRFSTLRVAFEESGRTDELRFALPRQGATLRDQLDRALATLPPADETAIRSRWLGGDFDMRSASTVRRLVLSPEEQAWLHSLPPLSVGFDADWPPFSYLDDAGHSSGISAEYLDYLGRTLGVKFRRAPMADWPATLKAFQKGELALLATATQDDPRLTNAYYTRAYESYPLVIVGREDEPAARSLDDFTARRVVVSAHVVGLIAQSSTGPPAQNLIVAASLDDALKLVAQGEADVFVGNVAAVDLMLKQQYAGTLKILGAVGESDTLRFALRSNLEPLAGLIDRALLAMPPAEKQLIRQRWVTGHADPHGGWSVTAVRLLPLLIGIGIVLAITLRAYVLLQREVRRRKRTETALASQLNFQQTLMEMVPYPLAAKDLDGRYIEINRAYEEASGLRRKDLIGRTICEVQAWGLSNSGRLAQMTHDTLRTGERAQLELEFIGRVGDVRHGIFWTALCKGGDGSPTCVLGTVIDITDIRRTEMCARETERRLFDVTRSLPAVVFQLRRDAHGKYSFPYIGGNTQHLLGGGASVLMPDDVIDLRRVCAEDRPKVMKALKHSARSEKPVHLEFRFDTPHGRRWGRAELVPRREMAGGVVWSGYWVDASVEHARSDELERARDLAEAASRAKDDFLAMMSHEIRTPMNGVLGLVELLERTTLNADQGEMLGMIHDSAGALLQILDDLLDYSKIEAGRLTMNVETLDLRELVDNAVGLLAGQAHEKGLKVRVDVEPEVAASLRGDGVRLRQVLFNLLGNAIKFTLQGEVEVYVSVAGQTADEQTIEIVVEDTGIGIEQEAQIRLFEPFVQAESSTTRRFGGTGLGLTICRKLVDLMGGALELQSTPGIGTRMTLRLVMPVEARRYTAGGLRGKRGLIAVNDERIAQALMHYGEALGLQLRCAAPDAAELRNAAGLVDLDLIFLCDSMDLPAAAQSSTRVIRITEKPKPTGYRIVEDTIRLSVNPISWRGLGAACAAALTGLAITPSRTPDIVDIGITPPDRARAIASNRLILVAEDHPVNQELIRHQLALLGFACDVVNDGLEALAALEQTRYGFLITDCHMPNLNGHELARKVREKEAGGLYRLPILGITANTAPEDLRLCHSAGMDDCLIKPTRLVTLREYLNRWFGIDSVHLPDSSVSPGGLGETDERLLECNSPADSFVPVDLRHMAQLWGSESTVKALLDSFVSAMRDDVRALPQLLEDIDVERLREWHHRVVGAVSVLQYSPLLGVLDEYRSEIMSKAPDELRTDGLALVRKCNAMLDGIEEQAALLV
ncbi:ATP-binding protein [Paraburkholderia bonniea]|uniref:ATP-binding protein n=1 Tax=Paraburkholderia bonniea TaxID=2152891 RepID=UPI003CCCC3F0